jgi:hypothetical protein
VQQRWSCLIRCLCIANISYSNSIFYNIDFNNFSGRTVTVTTAQIRTLERRRHRWDRLRIIRVLHLVDFHWPSSINRSLPDVNCATQIFFLFQINWNLLIKITSAKNNSSFPSSLVKSKLVESSINRICRCLRIMVGCRSGFLQTTEV